MRQTFVIVFALLVGVTLAQGPGSGPFVLPQPVSLTWGSQVVPISDASTFIIQSNVNSVTLNVATKRYSTLFFPFGNGTSTSGAPTQSLSIQVQSSNEDLALGVDESYKIAVDSASSLTITANTIYGAMRGLETFSQLLTYNPKSNSYSIPFAPISISDSPRFQWRGFMIDTARHYEPVNFILHIIDALGYNKFNVLHWHMVDAESFPVVSTTYPELSAKGAFNPLAIYTHDDIEEVVAYAKTYGIRVIPEFDIPGHAYGWGFGYPQLLAQCPGYAYNINNIALNIAEPFTYQVITGLFTEMAALFPDQYFHTGGDEVIFGCWLQDPSIVSWMNKMGFDSVHAETYFENQLTYILDGLNRTKIVWNDPFQNGVTLAPGTVVQIWNSADITQQVVDAGFKAIASYAWYFDKQQPMGVSTGEFENTWEVFYTSDPASGVTSNVDSVIGGEATMWSEQVDQMSWDTRVFPRALAVAERLWSAAYINDTNSALPRLEQQSCNIARRGVNSGPLEPDFCLIQTYLGMSRPNRLRPIIKLDRDTIKSILS
ncbi:hypothetical protein SAMD00019534_047290 [Acytostelium subglobosum LB1]|uniref:hypothetical protein n=1 Tax=Acytostelium subglobosum LB1 TaxID=1410327 RepID=UPI000644E857|nr:hypothetical protein SAMD00019534_047290 [Acytostelium subglobosum LB1]GAM21554.1 hypothetical protein SAMD00019534_047290 [Acytostelium subglobosum LB1]|eukprot:XP_012755673.1 hypothetical protein SAMD00019534_047290 [Acytostelium subglobosum LB1]